MAKVYRDTRMRNASGKPAWCLLYKGLDQKWHRKRTDAVTREQAEALLRRKLEIQTQAEAKGLSNLDHMKPLPFERFLWEEYMPAFKAQRGRGRLSPKHVPAKVRTGQACPPTLRENAPSVHPSP